VGKVLVLVVGVAIGVGLMLLLLQPKPQSPVSSRPELTPQVEGAAEQRANLTPIPVELASASRSTKHNISAVVPHSASEAPMASCLSEIAGLTERVSQRPTVTGSRGTYVEATGALSRPDISILSRPSMSITLAQAAIVAAAVAPTGDLFSGANQVQLHPAVEEPRAVHVAGLERPSGILPGQE